MAFAAGTLLGALVAWPGSPAWIQVLVVPFMTLSAFPYYLLGLILLYFFAVESQIFPLFGAYPPTMVPNYSMDFYLAIIRHATLPALSIILSGIGFWGLSMWGMMVTTMGEDYVVLAEANGLRPRDIFFRYGMRNAILPQATALALSLGFIVSGSVSRRSRLHLPRHWSTVVPGHSGFGLLPNIWNRFLHYRFRLAWRRWQLILLSAARSAHSHRAKRLRY